MSAARTPWQRYQADLTREGFSHDPAQEAAVRLLQDLYERLLVRRQAGSSLKTVWRRLRRQQQERARRVPVDKDW